VVKEKIATERPLTMTQKEWNLVSNADEILCPHDKVCICCTNLEKGKKFVRYRFPLNTNSIYEKDYRKHLKVGGKPIAFSNEKEWGNLTRSA